MQRNAHQKRRNADNGLHQNKANQNNGAARMGGAGRLFPHLQRMQDRQNQNRIGEHAVHELYSFRVFKQVAPPWRLDEQI